MCSRSLPGSIRAHLRSFSPAAARSPSPGTKKVAKIFAFHQSFVLVRSLPAFSALSLRISLIFYAFALRALEMRKLKPFSR